MKGLMNRCMAWEQLVDRLKERAESAKTEFRELEA